MIWIWIVFFLIYLGYTLISVTAFFYHESLMYQYYQILMAFDLYFMLPYLLNALAVILTVASIIPFYLFLFKIDFLNKDFWKYFLLTRLAVDLIGRSYEWGFVKSLSHHDIQIAAATAGIVVLVNLPSYLAIFSYAFPEFRSNSKK